MPKGRHRRPGTITAARTAATGLTASAGLALIAPHAHAMPAPPGHSETARVTAVQPVVTQAALMGVTVRAGDTLSGIAARDCGTPADWTGIYQRNKAIIGRDPDLIQPGQDLVLSCRQVIAPAEHAPPQSVQGTAVRDQPVSTAGMGAFQSCVIARESGGNPSIWNASGHWGLYQFSYATWTAHGGIPADFGRAGAGEQTQVFWATVRADGGSDWSPYDGCPY